MHKYANDSSMNCFELECNFERRNLKAIKMSLSVK